MKGDRDIPKRIEEAEMILSALKCQLADRTGLSPNERTPGTSAVPGA